MKERYMPIRNQALFYFRAFLIALLMMTGRFADAASIREVSMDEMLQQSQFVFEGMVTGVETAKGIIDPEFWTTS
jgi:hypothetical protein